MNNDFVNYELTIKNAEILFRNFIGKEGQFNTAGDRNFCVVVDREMVDKLMRDGWNVRFLKPRDEDELPKPYIQVKVSFDNRPPEIYIINGRNMRKLDEGQIHTLDMAEIEEVDLVIRPYNWGPIGGKSGVKAYVSKMWVTTKNSELDEKYADFISPPVNSN